MTDLRRFDGETFDFKQDSPRLSTQFERVRDLMRDGRWRTLAQIAQGAGGSESSVSARLRDLRKPRFGAFRVERERVEGGLHRYRLLPSGEAELRAEGQRTVVSPELPAPAWDAPALFDAAPSRPSANPYDARVA